MKRSLVVWCPDLLAEEETGRRTRALARVRTALEAFSPAVEEVRPGVCALGTRGPSRYFGGDRALAHRVALAVAVVEDAAGTEAGVGIADGLFAAVLAARRASGSEPVVVAPGDSAAFLAPWPVTTLERPELAELLVRLGIPTLGRFAAVPDGTVLARFGVEGAALHRVAKGLDGELPGLRAVPSRRPARRAGARQPGFFGGAAGAEARAGGSARRVQEILGPEAVVVGRLQGGRGPGERARLVPFGARRDAEPGASGASGASRASRASGASRASRTSRTSGADQPWPGRVPSPAPVVVHTRTWRALLAAVLAGFVRAFADFGATALLASGAGNAATAWLLVPIAATAWAALYVGNRLRHGQVLA